MKEISIQANKKIRISKSDIDILIHYHLLHLLHLKNNFIYEPIFIFQVLDNIKKLFKLKCKNKKEYIFTINLFIANEWRKLPIISDDEFFPYMWTKIIL